MAITISGQNNNDKILASDGVLDSISGFNVVGVLTASTIDVTGKTTTNHISIGNNIHLGNAGIITATTLLGNVTGNINHESNLLLQISGSEKFRVGNGGQFGIAGANYGTAGQVFTSGGSGSAPTWSTIASDKITEGNTEAEVVDTGSDGHFKVTTEGSERLRIDSSGRIGVGVAPTAQYAHNLIQIGNQATLGANASLSTTGQTFLTHNLYFDTGGTLKVFNTSSANEGAIIQLVDGIFKFSNSASTTGTPTVTERLRIDSAGRLLLGTTTEGHDAADNLTIADSGNCGITIRSGTSNNGNIYFSDGTSGGDEYRGYVNYNHSSNYMILATNGSERVRIDSSGYLGINQTPYARLDVKQDNAVAYNNTAQSITYNAARFLNTSGHQSGGTYTGFQFNLSGNGQNRICSIGAISEASNSKNSSLVFHTDDNSNRTEKLRINSLGQISIRGTTTAFDTTGDLDSLQLYYETDSGQASIGPYSSGGVTHLSFYTNNGGAPATEKLRITGSGRHGFNISSPHYAMHLSPAEGETRTDLHMTNDTTGHGAADGVQFGYQNSAGAYIWNFEDTDIYFATNNNRKMTIHNDGTLQVNNFLTSRNGIVQINQVTSTTRYSGSIASVDLITGSTFTPKTSAPRFLIMIFCPVNTSDDSDAGNGNRNDYFYGRIEYRKNGGGWLECNDQGSTSQQGGYAAHISLSPNRTGNNSTDYWSGNRYRMAHKNATVLVTNVGDCGSGGNVQFKLRGYSYSGSFVQIGQPHGNGTDDNYGVQPWGFTVFELAPDNNSYTAY